MLTINSLNIPEHEILAQVLDFMRSLDIEPFDDTQLMLDGKLHRYRVHDEKHGSTSGAYVIHTDGLPAGFVSDWRKGISENWHFDTKNLPQEQKKAISSKKAQKQYDAIRAKQRQEMEVLKAKAVEQARQLWNSLTPAPGDHPYLQRKNVYPYSLRVNSANTLAVPLCDINGNLQSLQWIFPDGSKRFHEGAPISNAFCSIAFDSISTDYEGVILLCEGFATMAKLYELTHYPAAAAMSCHSLVNIAGILHERYTKANIIVMADNDWQTAQKRGFNPGVEAGNEAQRKGFAAGVLAPVFADNEEGTDWDDYALLHGDDNTSGLLHKEIPHALVPPEIKAMASRLDVVDAQSLRSMVFPPIKWAVDGFLPSGLTILGGAPKAGKSIMALHLAVSVTIGGRALSKINVKQGYVLYLALEDTKRRLQDRLLGSGIDDEDDLSRLTFITEIPRQHEGGMQYLDWWLRTHQEARLVIIDTLQKFRKQLTSKGHMYSEDYDTISEIKALADKYDVAILVIHHVKKERVGDDWINEFSGSQGIAGSADTLFILKRNRGDKYATLYRTGREVEEQQFRVRMDNFGWYLEDEAEQFTMPEWKRQIVDYLKEHETVTPMELMQAYSLSHDAAKKNLSRLLKEGIIEKSGYGVYTIPKQ